MGAKARAQFFEGPEKKIEVVVRPRFPSLRTLGAETWRRVLARAQAAIVSRISNEACDAYLLSESSLFVFERRALLITCGRTTLAAAVEELLAIIPLAEIDVLIYERKNALFPEYQRSNFYDDAALLQALMPGRAYRFGDEDGHHVFLFSLERDYAPAAEDMTLEILMHGIDAAAADLFCSGPARRLDEIHARTRVRDVLPGFQVDDHLFEPQGYSLNAIRGAEYYTIHVSPQEIGSYVSFETNRCFGPGLEETVATVLGIFRPKSCDILFFHAGPRERPIECALALRSRVVERLRCGYHVQFCHYFRPEEGARRAVEISL